MAFKRFVWDMVNDCLLAETDENGATTVVYTNEPVPYGRLISQHRGGVTSYYHFDATGSTRMLTNDAQETTDTYVYTAFGELVASTGSTDNPFRYVGEFGYYYDGEALGYYVRERRYEPRIVRWLSADRLTASPLYAFCHNNPMSHADPSGLVPCGPPAGVDYIGGRGRFAVASLRSMAEHRLIGVHNIPDTPGYLESSMYALWEPDPSAFHGECVCCCDEIQYVQIFKKYVDYTGSLSIPAELLVNNDWKLDGGMPYPGGLTGPGELPKASNPCKSSIAIQFWDQPGAPASGLWGRAVINHYRMDFETCVYCTKGLEQPTRVYRGFRLEPYGGVWNYSQAITVYDCLEWFHDFQRVSPGRYRVQRGITRVGGPPSAAFIAVIEDAAPDDYASP